MFFVEARYHHSPKRAADQVRYIAHREIGLQGGEHRELYGIGARYRAFRGDEKAIGKALIDDARGLRNPVYFRFILTVDNRTSERFARLDGRLVERAFRDAVQKTFRSAARGVQGVFAIHQHGGADRPAHPHVHALLSPRFENKSPVHISPKGIQRMKERWETEVLRALERHERRPGPDRSPRVLPPPEPRRQPNRVHGAPLPARDRSRRIGPLTLAFVRLGRSLGLGRAARRGRAGQSRLNSDVNAFSRNPERFARRTTFRLFTNALPAPIRMALSAARGVAGLGLRQR